RERSAAAPPPGGAVASCGVEARRAHDDNGDGAIAAEDAVYRELLVWEDNGDGVSTPGELRPLSETGIVKLNVKFTESSGVDAAGSLLAMWGSFEREDGSTGLSCDVFFADDR